ncbi:MAG: YybH family protein [Ramlibacter sp.]
MHGIHQWLGLTALCGSLAACAVGAPAPAATGAGARDAVMAAERAFARSMAERDLPAFARHVSQEAVFFTTPDPLRGRQAIVQYWSRWYTGAQAPFSWEPEQVEVLAGGDLALSSGPVRSPQGRTVGRFTSVWRLESDGQWRVVFDKGSDVCDCGAR